MSTSRQSVPVVLLSSAIALLATVSSVLGLVAPGIYSHETANWTLQAQGQDVGNLVAVVVLMVSGLRYRAGSPRAGLVWFGTLLYFAYAFVVYAFAVHLNRLFLVYVAVLGLSVYGAVFAARGLREQAWEFPSGGRRAFAAWTLLGTGLLFALLWLSELVPALLDGVTPLSLVEAGLGVNPIHVLDLGLVLPAFIASGVGALRGSRLWLMAVACWLSFSVLMAASIVAAMALMAAGGSASAAVPAILVSVVLVVSALAAWRYLGGTRTPAGDVSSETAGRTA